MGMNWVPQHMELNHAHFQRFYKYSNGFLEEIFIWPFELNSFRAFCFPQFQFLLKFLHDAKAQANPSTYVSWGCDNYLAEQQ